MKFLAVQKNQLYTPAVLLFATGICFYLSSLFFKDTFFQYSYIFSIANLALCLRVFTLGFQNLEQNINAKKVALTTLNLGLSVAQIWLAVNSIRSLTLSSYPRDLNYFLLLASIPFFVQLFVSVDNSKLLKPAIGYILFQLFLYLGFVLLGLYSSAGSQEFAILENILPVIQQTVSYAVLIVEVWLLGLVLRRYVKAV